MRELYPEIEPFASGFLETSSSHAVYYEQVGNPSGIPVLFIHGGPGSGCNENHRRYFNPDKYHIVLFDQRGCNRSTPNGVVTDNTTGTLLEDIEQIRSITRIEKFVLLGGSWGATLALLYAEHYARHVSAMILRGSFLARQTDFEWFTGAGVNRILPDYWDEFISGFDVKNTRQLIDELHSRISSDERPVQLAAARAWSLWAGRVVTHSMNEEYMLDTSDEDKLIHEVSIEMHYAKNRYFIKDNQILDNAYMIPKVPVTIIHGRRDLTCLPETSWLLKEAMPGSNLVMVKAAGHLAGEPAMIDALVTATDKMATVLS